MRIRITSLLGLGLLLAAADARAQDDAVTIKVKETAKGDTVLVEQNQKITNQTKIVDGTGKVLQDKTDKLEDSSTFRETILEQEGKKRPTKLKRMYEKATLKEGDKTTELPYQGKTLLIEKKKDGKYHFQIEGGDELKEADAKLLNKEFNQSTKEEKFDLEKFLLPKKPVKMGDTWKIEMEPVVKDFTDNSKIEVDTAKATGTGKVVKVYKKDGVQYGELKFDLELPIKALPPGPDGKALPLEQGAKAKMDVTLDVCIDGSKVDGTMKGIMKMDIAANIPNVGKLNSTTEVVGTETHKEATKK
jgi:hypothetical protein